MNFCGNCGTQLQPDNLYCPSCGQGVTNPEAHPAAAPAVREQTQPSDSSRVIPPPAAPAQPTTATPSVPALGQKALQVALVGNWAGALFVAATVVGVAGFLATVLGLMAKPADFGLDNTFTLIAVLMTSAMGADLVVSSDMKGIDGSVDVGFFPLTLTILTLAATIFAFRKVTANYTSAALALGDAVRSAVVAAVPFLIVSLLFRADNNDFGPGWLSSLADDDHLVKIGASAAGAFFLTLVIVAATLAVTVLMRRDWLGPKLTRVHDWVAAPVAGLAALAVLLPIAGAVAWLAILLLGDGADTGDLNLDEWMTVVSGAILYAGNAGLALVTLGAAGKLGVSAEGSVHAVGQDLSQPYSVAHGLTWFTGSWGESGLWVAVVVTPLWLAAGAYVAARKAGYAGKGRPSSPAVVRGMACWVASLLVVVPLLVRLASIHGHGEVTGNLGAFTDELYMFGLGDVIRASADGSLGVGPVGMTATLLLTLYGAVVALGVAFALDVLDADQLKSRAAGFAKSIQVQPGAQPVEQPAPQPAATSSSPEAPQGPIQP